MRITRAFLFVVGLAAAAWSAVLTFAGGVSLQLAGMRVSSRDPVRPLGVAIAAILLLVVADARVRARLAQPVVARRSAGWLAACVAILVLLGGVRFGTFTAGGADPSGYVSQSALWRQGALIRPAPDWVAGAPWPDAPWTAAPLGYLPGPTSATQVPAYPPGLPLLMALARTLAGVDGEYLVVPLSAAVLVWATFVLALRLMGGVRRGPAKAGPHVRLPYARPAEAGPYIGDGPAQAGPCGGAGPCDAWAALGAAALMATSPPFLMWLVMPMSDIPASAAWAVALVCALSPRRSAVLGAGAATALAIVIRPNLAPLAVIVAIIVMTCADRPRRAASVFAALSGSGVMFLAVMNHALYGSALRSGYGNLSALYSLDFVWPNTQRYIAWFLSAQTIVPLLGLAAPLMVAGGKRRLATVAVAVAFPAVVVALYLPYLPFDEWSYLRFLLPAYPPLLAGLAVCLAEAARRWVRAGAMRVGLAGVVAIVAVRGLDYSNAASDLSASEPAYRRVASAAADVAPRTIFIAFQHSGSLRYYTGRDVLRWDLMDSAGIDAALTYLATGGHTLYWVGDAVEHAAVRNRFAGSEFLRRVEQTRGTTIGTVRIIDLTPAW